MNLIKLSKTYFLPIDNYEKPSKIINVINLAKYRFIKKIIKKYHLFYITEEKTAFALAELIIFFTIISVMLALSAPLLTGKSNADPDKLMQLGDNNKIQTALGNFQKFIVGHGNGDKNKLTVNGTARITGDLTVGDSVVESDKIRIGSADNTIFSVDNNGNTNLLMGFDKTQFLKQCSSQTSCIAPENGYVYVEDSTKGFTITETGGDVTQSNMTEIATSPLANENNLTIEVATKEDGSIEIKSYPRIVPISKGTTFNCQEGTCYFAQMVTDNVKQKNNILPSLINKTAAVVQAPYNFAEEWANFRAGKYEKCNLTGVTTTDRNNEFYYNGLSGGCKEFGCNSCYLEASYGNYYYQKITYDSRGNALVEKYPFLSESVNIYDENEEAIFNGDSCSYGDTVSSIHCSHGYATTNNVCKQYCDGSCSGTTCSCLVSGTMVALADGSTKAIQDIKFNDELKVWDFDNGCLSSAKPLWIKEAEIATEYRLLTFSDGRTLKTVMNHRIFNLDEGKYSYPREGMRTVLADGSIVTLEKREIIEQPVKYYNIVTEYHFNLYANGISTSSRLNNIYPISDMKFVKDDRKLIPYSEFEGIPYEWYEKLRLAEQPLEINRDGNNHGNTLNAYVQNMLRKNIRQYTMV